MHQMKPSALQRYTQKFKEKNYQSKADKSNSHRSNEGSIISRKHKTIPTQLQQTNNCESKLSSHKYYGSNVKNSLVFPRLGEQVVIRQKKALQNLSKSKNNKKYKYELTPLKKYEPVRLMKRSTSSNSSVSYLSMASSRRKLTDQYFSQMDNIRLAQNLLLIKPTRDSRKSVHQQFYQKQQKYKKNIQLSKSEPFKSKKVKANKQKMWLNN